MSAGLTTSERNSLDIRERTKKIDEIGGKLSQSFLDCAKEKTEVFFTRTKDLVNHFSIAISKDEGDDRLIVNVLGNGKIRIREYDAEKEKTRTLHKFKIRTNIDLDRIYGHVIFELSLKKKCRKAFAKYGVDINQGIIDAQNEELPKSKPQPRKPIPQKSLGKPLGVI